MLPRKRSMPAEPAANPFALTRPVQISVSDEITQVHDKKGASSVPPPLPPAAMRAKPSFMPAMPAVRPPPPPSMPSSSSKGPPPIPRELPRVSIAPPSMMDFESAPTSSQRGAVAVAADIDVEVEAAPESTRSDSDPTFAPIAMSRGSIANSRPNASWAMAMLALGVFGGVVTAIVAGGDTDTILRAGASFIDPEAANAHAVAPLSLKMDVPLHVQPTQPTRPAPVAAPVALAPTEKPQDKPAAIVGEPVHIKPETKVAEAKVAARPEPKVEAKEPKPEPVSKPAKADPKPEPKAETKVAWTAPVRRAEPRPAPPPRAEKTEKAEKVAEKADKPEDDLPLTASKKRRDELASAAVANALAKAQLEGSL